jgi:diaminopimelate epimerase
MIDNRLETFPKEDRTLVAHLCNRRFGIGGDGLILLEMIRNLILKWCITTQMEVKALCVNGGRCLVVSPKIKDDWK